jgi:predicted nucleotidyltransferase
MLSSAAIEGIAEALDRRFGVDALWVFGSEAMGRAQAESDLDLAVLFRTRPHAVELLDLRGEIAATMGRDVDLVDLEGASPVLAMQVLRNGKLLIDRDARHRVRFSAGAPARYEDLKRTRRPIEEALRERLVHGRP